jgi:hypothetical protein
MNLEIPPEVDFALLSHPEVDFALLSHPEVDFALLSHFRGICF